MSPRSKVICVLVVWFACGYVASAQWAGHFYGEFGASGAETKGTASRSSLLYFMFGPPAMFWMWGVAEYPPMWDWPKHLFEYRHVAGRERGEKGT